MRYWGVTAVLLFSTQAFAWGEFAHRAIGEIAQRNLCAQAKQMATTLLAGEDIPNAATWADDIRDQPQYKNTKDWHFVQMPLGTRYQDSTPYKGGDLVTAMTAQTARLSSSLSDTATKAEALRFILHFVGDSHQPLHAGEHGDYGGNDVDVTWFGYNTNLHHVWDTEFFDKIGGSYSALADSLIAEHKDHPSFDQLTVVDWVNESSAIAKTVYPNGSQLGADYYNKFLPEVRQRVWLAGMRLAGVLNQALGCSALDHPRGGH
jgi:hypothetical protein